MIKQQSFLISLWLISSSIFTVSPVWAETFSRSNTKPEAANKSSHLLAQSPPSNATLIRVTNVELYETDTGLELVLITADGQRLKPTTTTVGNTVVTDFPNAVLEIPGRKEIRSEKPIEGITLVTVANFGSDRIRVQITGQNALPKAVVRTEGQEFILAISPARDTKPQTTQESEEPIELVVTGTPEETYRVPESSVGTRTNTPIINVPQSIQVVPKQVIEEQGATTIGETLRNTAGVTSGRVASDAPAITPVIRGFESRNILRNGLRDATLRRLSEAQNIQRIEILRGPASVLFGQGDPGGTVNVVTKQPLDEPFYQLGYQVGQFGLHRPLFDFTGPFGSNPRLGTYRLNFSYQLSDSFKDFEESRSVLIAPVFKLINTERTQLTTEFEYNKFESSGNAPELPARGTALDTNPSGKIDRSVNLGEPSLAESETKVLRVGYRFNHEFSDNWSLRNELLFADADAPKNTGAFPRSLRPDGRTLERILLENPSEETSLTLNTNVTGKFATGSIKHELLLGFEFSQDTAEDVINITPLGEIDVFGPRYRPESLGNFVIPLQDFRTETSTIGFYLQDQISVLDNLILVLGGRFDIADQTYEDRLNVAQSFERQDQAFSPRVGIIYKPAENLSLYASYTRSFLPQIGRERLSQNIDDFGEPFEPERGTQYEVGFKADLLDERLSATLALYNLVRTNVRVAGANDPVAAFQAGRQRSRGVELNIAGEILPGWNILAGYAYTDAQIIEDDRDELEGSFLINVPKHAVSLWTTYEIQSSFLQGLGFGLGLFYLGEQQGDLENSFSLPSYLRTDATLFYRRNRLRVSLNFQNLFDVDYYEGARGNLRVIPGAPFNVFGKITWEF